MERGKAESMTILQVGMEVEVESVETFLITNDTYNATPNRRLRNENSPKLNSAQRNHFKVKYILDGGQRSHITIKMAIMTGWRWERVLTKVVFHKREMDGEWPSLVSSMSVESVQRRAKQATCLRINIIYTK